MAGLGTCALGAPTSGGEKSQAPPKRFEINYGIPGRGRQSVNLPCFLPKKSHESATDPQKIVISGHFGGPPQRSPESQGARVLDPRN